MVDSSFEHSMNSQIFSRDYLQSAPQLKKQKLIDCIVSGFIEQLKQNASEGKTEYRINLDIDENGSRRNYLHVGSMMGVNHVSSQIRNKLTDAELVAGLFTRFPGCKIYYDEKTIEKGINIDWS